MVSQNSKYLLSAELHKMQFLPFCKILHCSSLANYPRCEIGVTRGQLNGSSGASHPQFEPMPAKFQGPAGRAESLKCDAATPVATPPQLHRRG